MNLKNKRKHTPLWITALTVLAIGGFVWYQATPAGTAGQPVVIAYQTGVDPGKLAQADGDYERNSNRAIEWKKFDSGSDVVNALASGNVVIGNIGSSPFAAAASRNLPIDTFLITSRLGDSEALVVSNRSGIKEPRDLIGKTIAVPFVSTTHYSLLCALKNWGISEDQTKIINLRPPEIAAAWARGDIDATYVWEPVLGKVKANGTVLTDSGKLAEQGAATYDLWVVRRDFAENNPDFLKSFVQTTLKSISDYHQNPKAFADNAEHARKIAALTGSNTNDIPLLLTGNTYLNEFQQREVLQGEFAQNIADTANFLKSQGKVDQVKPDYHDHINVRFLQP